MTAVAQWVTGACGRLEAAGIDSALYDARLLAAEALGVEMRRLPGHARSELTPAEEDRLETLLARREAREPMSHILGRRGFWTLDFEVTADTLDPRPDTETLVEGGLAEIADRAAPLRLLDFGTGTGCILLSLLSELGHATGLGIDASEGALAVARRNAEASGLLGRAEFRPGNWGEGLEGEFDVIVSNPPYIPDAEIDTLEPEVARYEPRSALAGGSDGLDCYRALMPHLARLIAPGGLIALEVGAGQAGDVAALLAEAGLPGAWTRCDLGGIERCVMVRRIK